MRAGDIAEMLARDAEGICEMLLPNGKRQGNEWCVGSIDGEAGDSCRVHLTGSKAGVWKDFGSHERGGDLLDLWAASKGIPLPDAIAEAKSYLGISDTRFHGYRPPERRPEKPKCHAPRGEVLQWLKDRKLTEAAIREYRIAATDSEVVFPYLHDELVFCKLRNIHDKKRMRVVKDSVPCLFGWQAIPDDAREVVICEGELDAPSWWVMGYPALSVPNGAQGFSWIETEFDRLERFDRIYIAFDADDAGHRGALDLAERLGIERCQLVDTSPWKDANDVIQAGQYMAGAEMIRKAKPIAPHELKAAPDFTDAVVREFYPSNETPTGFAAPWPKCDGKLAFRYSELTIINGVNGHGKALCLNTAIPTPDGWRRFGDLKPGDCLFDENGCVCNVVAETPVQIGRPCYRLRFSDGSEIIADEQHEWVTDTVLSRASARNAKLPRTGSGVDQSHKRKLPSIVTTMEIASTLRPASGCRSHLINHSIRTCGALQHEPKELPIDPYILGAWLGDGSSNDSGMTSADYEVIEHFVDAGFTVVKGCRYRYGITGGLHVQLRANGLLNNKHVPEIYLRGSVDQRMALLQGLMDTDGHVTDYGRCEFTNTNRKLAEAVLDLVLSLGVQAKILIGRATLYGKDCGEKYRVTFTPDFPAFRLRRKAKKLRPSISERAKHRFIVACDRVASVPVKCIQVDSESRLFLAGRAMIPTHNSQMAGQLCLAGMNQGERVCIASMEIKPERLLYRLTRQAAALQAGLPTEGYVREIMEWYRDKCWIFSLVGTAKADRLLEVFRYARNRFGVRVFLVDSLLKCGIAEDDYNGQKQFVERLCDFKNETDSHVLLVTHSRKHENEEKPTGKMDVRGAGAITDLADNTTTVWRNKKKEAKLHEAEMVNAEPDPEWEKKPDSLWIWDKQRNGEWEGKIAFWWHPNSMSFVGKPDGRALPVIQYQEAKAA